MDTDRNLLFGVLALQTDLIDSTKFVEACAAWAARKDLPLADLLVDRGWLTPVDRADVYRLLERKLKRFGGDARVSLAAIADGGVRDVIKSVNDSEIRKSISSLPPAAGHVLVETLMKPSDGRSRYTLSRLHAEGGLGRVWVARDGDLNREVALKELQPEQAAHPEACRRFLKEAQVTGQLEHPNIVPVYELSHRAQDDQPFYTMRFVRGQTLREAIAEHHRHLGEARADALERPRLLHAFVSVCHAIGYAHSRGVVHRDLKPENVVLGGFGEVIVLDWGLAKLVSESPADHEAATRDPLVAITKPAKGDATVAGRALGTPAYMAPEQAEGRLDCIDARTDIYGLGAILFEMLTGRPPHQGQDTEELLRRIIHGKTPYARSINPLVPRALDAICVKAMAHSRAERYARAPDLADDVQRYLADEPMSAFNDPLQIRAARWARRHKPLVAAVAVLLVTAVVALSVSTVFIRREQSRTQAALAKAEGGFLKAEKAVQDYFVRVSQETLLNEPGMHPLRKDLLQLALDYYKSFLQERQGDQTVQRELALAHFRVGIINDDLGMAGDASAAYEQASQILEAIAQKDPLDTAILRDLGRTYNNLGTIQQRNGDLERARRSYDQALAIRERLVRDQPGFSEYKYDLAKCLVNIGKLHKIRGETNESHRLFAKAIEILETFDQQPTPDATIRSSLVAAYINLAAVQTRTEAMRSHDRAIDIQRQLVQQNPKLMRERHQLAILYRASAKPYQFEQPDAALGFYEQSFEISDELHRQNPAVHDFQEALAGTCDQMAFLIQQHPALPGGLPRAIDLCQKSRELYDQLVRANPSNTDYQAQQVNVLNMVGLLQRDSGHIDESLQTFQEALIVAAEHLRSNPSVVRHQLDLFMTHANIGRLHSSQQDWNRAMVAYESARDLMEDIFSKDNDNPNNRQNMMHVYEDLLNSYCHAGFVTKGFDLTKKLRELAPKDMRNLYNTACGFALCASSVAAVKTLKEAGEDVKAAHSQYVEFAVEALQQAVDEGWNDLVHTENDPDLEPVRQHPGYKAAIGRLKSLQEKKH